MQEDLKELTHPANLLQIAFIAVILGTLYLISTVNYLLFHGIVELAGIAVAFSIFIIVWNTRRDIHDLFFLIVGISFLFIGSIDLVHTLAYKGMGAFPGNNSDLPTQLWIAARYFQSIAFLVSSDDHEETDRGGTAVVQSSCSHRQTSTGRTGPPTGHRRP